MAEAGAAYAAIQAILNAHGRGAKANEDARFVLPNACETKIVVTMNCRSLLHFFELRCCMRAQWEIRALAESMLARCREVLPVVFAGAGALRAPGLLPEAERFSCGRYPVKPDLS
jgi:thymidylate synthase (FAD)